MTRDELEAIVRRELTHATGLPSQLDCTTSMNRATDKILAAHDAALAAELAATAERRQVLADATTKRGPRHVG